MAINFTRLFTRLGHLGGGVNVVNTYRGTTYPARVVTVAADYASVDMDLISALYTQEDATQSAQASTASYLASLASAAVQREVGTDRNLTSLSLSTALVELDRQMRIATETLKAYPATVAVTPTLVDGDLLVIATTFNGRGLGSSLALPDTYISRPTGIGYAPSLTLVGTAAADPLDYTYPTGSGVNSTLSPGDAGTSGGLLLNGPLQTFTTPPTPDSWTLAGTGVTWTQQTDDPRGGSGISCLQAAVTGAGTATADQQVSSLQPYSIYAWTLKVKEVAVTSYTVRVALTDSAGTPLVSDAAVNQIATSADSAYATGTWTTIGGFFFTPGNVPTTARFQIGLTTATGTVKFAHAGLTQVTPLYAGGPCVYAWGGTTKASPRDQWSTAVSLAGSSSASLLRSCNRLLNVASVLPNGLPVTTGTATQLDALLV